jgi:hypothetical protein
VLGIIFEADAPHIYETGFNKRINKLCNYRTPNLYCTGKERILKPVQLFRDTLYVEGRTRIAAFTMSITSEHRLKFN